MCVTYTPLCAICGMRRPCRHDKRCRPFVGHVVALRNGDLMFTAEIVYAGYESIELLADNWAYSERLDLRRNPDGELYWRIDRLPFHL